MSLAMASRAAAAALRAAAAQRYGRPSSSSVLQSRSTATAAAAAAAAEHPEAAAAAARKAGTGGGGLPRGDYVPVYVALGLIALSAALGLHTARQQLAHAPNVYVDKKKREAVPEVAAPEVALDEAERFVGRSLFRKVAHVQDGRSLAEYPTKKAVTLKDVGVETPGIEQSREGIVDRIFKKNHA